MPKQITVSEFTIALLEPVPKMVALDVRKPHARKASGLTIGGAPHRLPFDAENWWQDFAGQNLVVFCVHGHEVSQAVCGFLNDCGIEAVYLEGGFEAYRTSGGETVSIGDADE